MHPYVKEVIKKIEQSTGEQEEKLNELAKEISKSVQKGGIIHILGTGHSHMIAEEIFYRAGGVLFINPILESNLMLHEDPVKSTRIERIPAYADAILDGIDMREEDTFIVISNSGRNAVPIEAALYAKKKNLRTVSITSLAHSQSISSRHESGKKLYELTDYVLDNYGEAGDAVLELESSGEKYGPTSSAVGIVLIQTLVSLIIENLAKDGFQVPLMESANLDSGDNKNAELIQKFKDRIPLLK